MMSVLDRLERYIQLDDLINCVLVQGDVRPAAIIYPKFDFVINEDTKLDHYGITELLLNTCFSGLSYVIDRKNDYILRAIIIIQNLTAKDLATTPNNLVKY
jgi:hypothetical protein